MCNGIACCSPGSCWNAGLLRHPEDGGDLTLLDCREESRRSRARRRMGGGGALHRPAAAGRVSAR